LTRYLLDTNIVSDLVRRPLGRVAAGIARVGEENVCTSVVVAAELRYGVAKKGSAALSERVDAILRSLTVVPLDVPCDRTYGAVRARLERAGLAIGALDTWIAAHALSLNCTIVTNNEREFARVPELAIENWLHP
jgi:tRNA(fMet)-specific endonuclease VapC